MANLAGDGIHVGAVQRASIADTVARGNGGHGAHLSYGRTNVSNSRFMANGGSGFYLEAGALGATAAVSDSVASGNGDRGFSAKALLGNNIVMFNQTNTDGIVTGPAGP